MIELPADFTHLSVHSHFSLLRATPSIDDLVGRAVDDGRRALALTDTNALYGAIAFGRACAQAGIRPIIGMSAGLAILPGEMYPDAQAVWGEVTLLATNAVGYQSLCRLSSRLQSRPQTDNQSEPMLTWDELQQDNAGLVCLTGGRTSWLERFVRAGNHLAATHTLGRLGGIFGDRCYLAIRPELLIDSDSLGTELMAIGRRFGLRAAAVQPIYCLQESDQHLLRVMAAIRHNAPVASVEPEWLPAFGDGVSTVTWPDTDRLVEAYRAYPELLTTTSDIARLCTQEEVLPAPRIWTIGLPGTASDSMDDSPLMAQATTGLHRFYGSDVSPQISGRLAHEVEAIEEMGYGDLFLVVADIVRYAREKGIAVSTRGSVADSLVAYCLGISTVDPIAHDLIFERFMNPARRNPPDIDLDFCSRRRDEVLHYVRETYGADRVALVSTMSTLQLRSAVRETAKAYRLSPETVQELVAILPRRWHPDPRRRDSQSLEDILSKVTDEQQAEVLSAAYELVGYPHHASIHPGGIVITPGPLTDVVPLELAPKGFLITQYTHEDLEDIGLPKIDLLGIRALTVLSDAADLVREGREPGFHPDDIPMDDPATGDLLTAAETIGVFQCESEGARRTLRQLRARTLADLAIAGAFFKPGPATGGMARAFVRRYRGEQAVTYLHPSLEPILGRTKGVLIFQEQVLRVVREIAGLSWAEADHIRRGMSKFKAREMEALAAEFIAGCCRPEPDGPGMRAEQARTLWEQVVAFAGYGFNQGHATAYADVSYRSAYIKAHWPAEFLAARLADAGGFHHQAIYIAEARRLGIPVRPPHVNISNSHFTLSYEAGDGDIQARHPVLWMGLGQVRGLQRATTRAIREARMGGLFVSLDDFLQRIRPQAKEIQALIQCGALDGLGLNRQSMLEEAEHTQRAGAVGQMAFAFAEPIAHVMESPRQRFHWEKDILSLPLTVSPLDVAQPASDAVRLRQLPEKAGRAVVIDAYRLPGWTGGKGTFISDGDAYLAARLAGADKSNLQFRPVWEPMRLYGRWINDEWGNGWFQVEQMEEPGELS
ncbi:MAG: DNA polymerase III subunit alpha [Chloroflexota bacterium]